MIEIPEAAIALTKRFEGFHKVPKNDPHGYAHPYICPAGFWTIGFGHLCNEDHPPITQDEGEVYLTQDLQTALNATLRYCPVLATEPRDGSRPLSISRSTLARGGCRRRRCGGGSTKGTGRAQRRSCSGGFMVEGRYCPGW